MRYDNKAKAKDQRTVTEHAWWRHVGPDADFNAFEQKSEQRVCKVATQTSASRRQILRTLERLLAESRLRWPGAKKLPLKKGSAKPLFCTGSLCSTLSRLADPIVGPRDYPLLVGEALATAMGKAGIADPFSKVSTSHIPLRHLG